MIGFIAIFSDNQKYAQYIIVFEAAKSLRANDKIVLVYYAVERGFNKIFNNDKNGIKKLYSSNIIKTESEQCILPEFSNFNCFINWCLKNGETFSLILLNLDEIYVIIILVVKLSTSLI